MYNKIIVGFTIKEEYENEIDKNRGKIWELTIQFQEKSSNWTSWTTELEAKKAYI